MGRNEYRVEALEAKVSTLEKAVLALIKSTGNEMPIDEFVRRNS